MSHELGSTTRRGLPEPCRASALRDRGALSIGSTRAQHVTVLLRDGPLRRNVRLLNSRVDREHSKPGTWVTLGECSIRAWTRCTNATFPQLILGGLENLDRHLFPAEHALQFLDPLLRRAEFARRHDILIRRDRRLSALLQQMFPSRDLRAGNPQLATQLGCGNVSTQHAFDLLAHSRGAATHNPVDRRDRRGDVAIVSTTSRRGAIVCIDFSNEPDAFAPLRNPIACDSTP